MLLQGDSNDDDDDDGGVLQREIDLCTCVYMPHQSVPHGDETVSKEVTEIGHGVVGRFAGCRF